MVFANNGGGQNSSTIEEYALDGTKIFSYAGGEYTANLGDVQRLLNGNTLVTYSNAGVAHEVDAQGTLVMRFSSPVYF